ncbi:hypothetical protein POTOM_061987 [Populus tomentosa]|uniref:Uncharacterized protein n=1 Tax=Populus tomentosa TaxID=118781 RepID=A0A8X7XS95_POPTO|nr:hypothetical protein POTOM_061987 [Populus tomentosa]
MGSNSKENELSSHGELPDDWKNAPDIHSLHSLARSFVFPGEQVHILASLSAYKQDTEIITPFKVAAVMSKNGVGQSPKKQNGDLEDGSDFVTAQGKMEYYKRLSEVLLERFKNSHFFVKIAELGEPLCALIDRGNFDTNVSGGAARNGVSCCSLSNGDIVKSSSSVSQLFSHFRSYSMSSLPQNSAPPPQPVKAQSSKPNFDLENWDQYSSQKLWKSIYVPGRRWWRKLEIIQPTEIHSFAADCNTDDLLCVQIKNISPEHIPDIVVDIDAITIVFEEASKSGLPSSLPIACIEAGNDHSLPDLALRRGEEHSFFLKPASSVKDSKVHKERLSPSCGLHLVPNTMEGISALNADQYAIMISCRCNYTVSRKLLLSLSAAPGTILCDYHVREMKWNSDGGVQSVSFIEQSSSISDVISSTGLGCTHLWLQSRVPLGCVPVQSTTTIKLELLPLTDGIISLNTFS